MESRLSGTSILSGTFTCLSLILLLSLFGAGVGLSGSDFSWGLLIPAAALVIIVPFFIAGWVTTRSSFSAARYLNAFTVWGISTVVVAFLIGSQASALAGGVLKQLGLGAGANVQARAMIEELRELRPTFVTDVEIKEGKATTVLHLNPNSGALSRSTAKAAKKEADTVSGASSSLDDTFASVAPEIKQATAATTWAAFFSMILALLAIFVGARFARRTSAPAH